MSIDHLEATIKEIKDAQAVLIFADKQELKISTKHLPPNIKPGHEVYLEIKPEPKYVTTDHKAILNELLKPQPEES